jgi:hypothetical protein
VEFSPLEIREPGFIELELDPVPADAEAAAVLSVAGTQVIISLMPAAWQGVLLPGQELTAGLTGHIQAELTGQTELRLPVSSSAGAVEAAVRIELASDTAEILDSGIAFHLLVPDGGLTVEQLAGVDLDSSNLLLALNANEFAVEVEAIAESGNSEWRLLLLRDSGAMTDVSYDLLTAELLESNEVEIGLEWTELGQSLNGAVKFIKTGSNGDAAAQDEPETDSPR